MWCRRPRSRSAYPSATPATVGKVAVIAVTCPDIPAPIARSIASPAEATAPTAVAAQKARPSDGLRQRTSMTHASAPSAAHCRSVSVARGNPQFVGKRSSTVWSHRQVQRGAV